MKGLWGACSMFLLLLGLGLIVGDRERKMYYVELKGDSKICDDEKGLMLEGVKMFAFADKGQCCFYLAKYELKAVLENDRVVSVEEAPENADLEIFL